MSYLDEEFARDGRLDAEEDISQQEPVVGFESGGLSSPLLRGSFAFNRNGVSSDLASSVRAESLTHFLELLPHCNKSLHSYTDTHPHPQILDNVQVASAFESEPLRQQLEKLWQQQSSPHSVQK